MFFLPYGRQIIEEDDIAAVAAVLRSDWLTTGPAVSAFEAAVCDVTGAQYAIACSNGTAALHLAVLALGLGPGDRAIVPSVTFLATANAVRLAGAEVIFADCDPESGLMEASHLADALDKAEGPVKAVLPVHLAGQCADPLSIRRLADRHGCVVIDDAAHAIGSTYRTADGQSGAVGDGRLTEMTTFSFHPVKTVTMGEGGAVTTNDGASAGRLQRLRNHGMSRNPDDMTQTSLAFDAEGEMNPWYYEMRDLGLNYRATDIQCALGLSQLKKLGRFLVQRRALVERYDHMLAALSPALRPIARSRACDAAWHLYPVLIDFVAAGIDRSAVMRGLRDAGVGSQVHYIPVHLQPYYQQRYGAQSLPGAERYYARSLSLPLFAGMQDSDVDRVVETLGGILESGQAMAQITQPRAGMGGA